MDLDERADYQQHMDEVRRMAEEEVARWRLANPLWDKCPRHPERNMVDPDYRLLSFCAECVQMNKDCYAEDYKPGAGNTYEYCGPQIIGSDGKLYREQRLK